MEAKANKINPEPKHGAKTFVKEAGEAWMDIDANINQRFGIKASKVKTSQIIDKAIDWANQISTFQDSSHHDHLNTADKAKLHRLLSQISTLIEKGKRLEIKLSVVEKKKKKLPKYTYLHDYFAPVKKKKGIIAINGLKSHPSYKSKIQAKESIHIKKAFEDLEYMLPPNFIKDPIGSQSTFWKALQKSMPKTVNWSTFNKEYNRSLQKDYYDSELLSLIKTQILGILKANITSKKRQE